MPVSLRGRAALSSVKVAVGESDRTWIAGDGAEWRWACLALLRSCSSSVILSSSSSPMPSRLGAVAALGTSMTVPLSSGGNGDFASSRLKTFIELRRGRRAAFKRDCRCPLCVDRASESSKALSSPKALCECWLPILAPLPARSLGCRAGFVRWRGRPLSLDDSRGVRWEACDAPSIDRFCWIACLSSLTGRVVAPLVSPTFNVAGRCERESREGGSRGRSEA